MLKGIWSILFDGCQLDRDTRSAVDETFGSKNVHAEDLIIGATPLRQLAGHYFLGHAEK